MQKKRDTGLLEIEKVQTKRKVKRVSNRRFKRKLKKIKKVDTIKTENQCNRSKIGLQKVIF